MTADHESRDTSTAASEITDHLLRTVLARQWGPWSGDHEPHYSPDQIQAARSAIAAARTSAAPALDMRAFPMAKGPAIPWFLAEAIYDEVYAAQNGRSQSLERIAERGGFSWSEVAFMWEDKRRKGLAGMRERCRQRVLAALSTSGAAE